MERRYGVVTSGLAAMITVMALASTLGARQTAKPSATAAAEARTPWGDPDISGIWDAFTLTPLERPAKYAGRTTLTDKEVEELTKELYAGQLEDQPRSGNDEHDVAGAYNHSVFMEHVTKFTKNRTSLVVDPPDGK